MASVRSDRGSADAPPKAVKPSCETCYFGCRLLCALDLGAPCTTYRPDSPEGLLPPAQPTLLMTTQAETDSPVSVAPRQAPVFVDHTPVQLDLRDLALA